MPENRRQDFRIDDILAMSDQWIAEDVYHTWKQQPSIRSRQNSVLQNIMHKDVMSGDLKDSLHHDMAAAIETLDNKLNYLIGVNMLNDANRSDLQERPVNLSITGASFHTKAHYNVGDHSQITLMLPSFPPVILELVGKVTWVKQVTDTTQHVGVKFSYRCDEEESSVGKYVFQRHRESIRLQIKETESN